MILSQQGEDFNSQWIKDLEIRPETLHLIEEKVGPNLQHVSLGSDFLNRTPIAQEIKARINNSQPVQNSTQNGSRI